MVHVQIDWHAVLHFRTACLEPDSNSDAKGAKKKLEEAEKKFDAEVANLGGWSWASRTTPTGVVRKLACSPTGAFVTTASVVTDWDRQNIRRGTSLALDLAAPKNVTKHVVFLWKLHDLTPDTRDLVGVHSDEITGIQFPSELFRKTLSKTNANLGGGKDASGSVICTSSLDETVRVWKWSFMNGVTTGSSSVADDDDDENDNARRHGKQRRKRNPYAQLGGDLILGRLAQQNYSSRQAQLMRARQRQLVQQQLQQQRQQRKLLLSNSQASVASAATAANADGANRAQQNTGGAGANAPAALGTLFDAHTLDKFPIRVEKALIGTAEASKKQQRVKCRGCW
jgi:hypothetical protein